MSPIPVRRGRPGLQLGIHVGQQNTTMSDLIERVQRFDAVVDWVSVWDHLYEAPPSGGNTPHFEAVATLGTLAAVTSRARLGCLMFCVPFRNPALLAKACVAIDHASGGRFEPGFGAGWHEPEFKAHGYDFPSLGTRFDMLTDGMEIITGMFSGDGTTYTGKHSSVDAVTCVPGPLAGSMPLWAGGRGPKRTPAIAARYCSGWNVPYVGPDEFRQLNRQLDDACTTIGRDPATLERSVNLAFHMGATREAADGELQRIVDQWGSEMALRVTQGALTGTPDDAIEQIAEFRDAGADLINVALRLPVDDDALTAYLESVIPAAHAAFA